MLTGAPSWRNARRSSKAPPRSVAGAERGGRHLARQFVPGEAEGRDGRQMLLGAEPFLQCGVERIAQRAVFLAEGAGPVSDMCWIVGEGFCRFHRVATLFSPPADCDRGLFL